MIERIKSAMVGLGASWVLWLMFVLSVVSLAIMLERAWFYWSLRDDVAALMRDLGRGDGAKEMIVLAHLALENKLHLIELRDQ